ncbi:MAG: thiamine ABC transporter substrate-binding protein, partial [Actinobacteria bacterium]|nr:thiamine ABC transporter substrate-binding protein [Actinomycetota bacterium]
LVDFLLSPTFQADIPLNMFVEPANGTVELPAEFEANRVPIEHPLTMAPADIEAGRDAWTEAWTRTVLR